MLIVASCFGFGIVRKKDKIHPGVAACYGSLIFVFAFVI
jgi:hypothetical protein